VHGTSLYFGQVRKRCRPRLHACNDGRHSTEQALSTFVYRAIEELLYHDLILRSRATVYMYTLTTLHRYCIRKLNLSYCKQKVQAFNHVPFSASTYGYSMKSISLCRYGSIYSVKSHVLLRSSNSRQ
jgi:hypothetical protein